MTPDIVLHRSDCCGCGKYCPHEHNRVGEEGNRFQPLRKEESFVGWKPHENCGAVREPSAPRSDLCLVSQGMLVRQFIILTPLSSDALRQVQKPDVALWYRTLRVLLVCAPHQPSLISTLHCQLKDYEHVRPDRRNWRLRVPAMRLYPTLHLECLDGLR